CSIGFFVFPGVLYAAVVDARKSLPVRCRGWDRGRGRRAVLRLEFESADGLRRARRPVLNLRRELLPLGLGLLQVAVGRQRARASGPILVILAGHGRRAPAPGLCGVTQLWL